TGTSPRVRAAAKSQGVEPHRPSRPSRETLRTFAANRKSRLKPRFVLTVRQYDWAGHCPSIAGISAVSRGLGMSAPETFQSSVDKRTMVSADFSTNFHS